MHKLQHVQPYWQQHGPKTIPKISDVKTARQWLNEREKKTGWTPLFEESFQGRVINVVDVLKLAKRAYGMAGLREYIRIKDTVVGLDAYDWTSLRRDNNSFVLAMLKKYGEY